MSCENKIPIIIVGYKNPEDVAGCLSALSQAQNEPSFEIFICENGGPEAYDALIAALTAADGPCLNARDDNELTTPQLDRRQVLELGPAGSGRRVHVGAARENLGYAGGINAWLRPLLAVPDWPAAWILNPDTEPAPDALFELAEYSRRSDKGMVGSRLVPKALPDRVHCRGLVWRRLRASTYTVDRFADGHFEPDPDAVDARLDAPSGASMYVTRTCIEQIGLMDERYFLYFEDLEWGLRAKPAFGVGYAHRSIVIHKGGTTIGSSLRKGDQSQLSIYLNFRNRILFVRNNFRLWLPWTILMQLVHALIFGLLGRMETLRAAFRGTVAGIAGESGRPAAAFSRNSQPFRKPAS